MEVTLSQLHTRSKTFSKNPCSERFTKQTRVTTTCNLQLKPKGVIVACDGLQPPNNPCHPFNDHLACPNISSFYEHSVKYQAKVVFMKDKYQLHTRSHHNCVIVGDLTFIASWCILSLCNYLANFTKTLQDVV